MFGHAEGEDENIWRVQGITGKHINIYLFVDLTEQNPDGFEGIE